MKIELVTSSWCNQCPNLKRIFDQMNVDYILIDVDENPEYAQQNRIRSLPSVIITTDDIKIVETGVKDRNYWQSLLSSLY
jgi:glutaredoxin